MSDDPISRAWKRLGRQATVCLVIYETLLAALVVAVITGVIR